MPILKTNICVYQQLILVLFPTHHIELALLIEQRRKYERRQTTGTQRQIRVNHRSMLIIPNGQGTIKAWPKEPQEHGSNHGEDVRVVVGGFVVVVLDVRAVDHARARQAKVGAEDVHEHRTADVYGLEIQGYLS